MDRQGYGNRGRLPMTPLATANGPVVEQAGLDRSSVTRALEALRRLG